MKKAAAMLMAIWMLALTACGQQPPEQAGGSVEPGTTPD